MVFGSVEPPTVGRPDGWGQELSSKELSVNGRPGPFQGPSRGSIPRSSTREGCEVVHVTSTPEGVKGPHHAAIVYRLGRQVLNLGDGVRLSVVVLIGSRPPGRRALAC